ncbi:endoglucanase [Seiridium cupressi]
MVQANTQTLAAAALALFSTAANGHMIMAKPKALRGVDATKMAIGQTQKLSFTGSAVHGGGSCQLAVTSDAAPTASTAWQVILSIEGGCPSKSGGAADEYEFTIPTGIQPGKYVFAWTWVPHMSGAPEFYMNCAPIEVTGGAAKRSDNDTVQISELVTRDAFPNLNVINLAGVNDCSTAKDQANDLVWPDPGSNLKKLAASPKYQEMAQGTKPCAPGGGGTPSSGSSGSGGSSAGGSGSGSSAGAGSSAAASPSSPAGSGFQTSTKPASTSAAANPTTSAAPAKTTTGNASATTGSGSSGSAGGKSGQCASEGIFFCVSGSQYQQCASGAWTALKPMPAGTKCKEGESTSLWARDEVRALRVRRK